MARVSDDDAEIADALQEGTAAAVSNGSFKDAQGASAFIIEGSSSNGRLVGVNIMQGEEESQSPCRSKLGGVAGVLEALHCTCVAHSVTKGHVVVGLDGKQAMKEAFSKWPLDPSHPDHDLLQRIRRMTQASLLSFASRWTIPSQFRT
jgi:hypothetical protein